jgi:CubicO group peptidase (beta-lactamase class C family)
MKWLARALVCACAAAAFVSPIAIAAAPNRLLTGIDDYIEQVRQTWSAVGLAVAVVDGQNVIYSHGFGLRAIGQPGAVDANTLFQVGSTTKAFTAAAVGVLVDEGKLRWDDPVINYVPELQLRDAWLTRHLTVRDTLTHRSGFADTNYYAFLGIMDPARTLGQLRYIDPDGAFRDSFRYSNLMYALAGRVIEAVSGVSWHAFIQRRLLEPLQMSRSGTSPYEFWDAAYVTPTFLGSAPAGTPRTSDARDRDVAMPHGWDEQGRVVVLPWRSYDNAAAAGSIVSSVSDMAKWLMLHVNGGAFGGRQVISAAALEELHAPQNLHDGGRQFPFKREGSYAMGWHREEYDGRVYLAHAGGMIGFPAYVALLPEQKIGIVVLSNGPQSVRDSYTLHQAIAFWVADRLLGAPGKRWDRELLREAQAARRASQEMEQRLARSRLEDAPPSLPLSQYTGTYEDQKGHSGPVRVVLDHGGLKLSFDGDGAFSAWLQPWHHDVFRLRTDAAIADVLAGDVSEATGFVSFSLDPLGQVSSMSAFQARFDRLP